MNFYCIAESRNGKYYFFRMSLSVLPVPAFFQASLTAELQISLPNGCLNCSSGAICWPQRRIAGKAAGHGTWLGAGPKDCARDDSVLGCLLLRWVLAFSSVAGDEPGVWFLSFLFSRAFQPPRLWRWVQSCVFCIRRHRNEHNQVLVFPSSVPQDAFFVGKLF